MVTNNLYWIKVKLYMTIDKILYRRDFFSPSL